MGDAENTPTPNTHNLSLSLCHWGLGSLTKAQLDLEQWFPPSFGHTPPEQL